MSNIRVVRLSVRSSTQIEITFTSHLSTDIGINNIEIKAAAGTQTDLYIKSVEIDENILTVYTRPMVSNALYEVILKSTTSQNFEGKNGEKLIDDGLTNHIFFTGKEGQNEVRDDILTSIESQKIYNTDGTLIRDVISAGADQILQAKHAVGEARSAKFISVTVEDEPMVRGSSPTDRFKNEGVFQILRVGKNMAGSTAQGSFIYDEFPEDPISLQQVSTTENVSNNEVKETSYESDTKEQEQVEEPASFNEVDSDQNNSNNLGYNNTQ